MEELQKAPVAFSHSSTEETRSTAVQGQSEVTAGAQQPIIMTRIKNGDFVRHVFSVTEVVQMATAVIFLSCMMVKCTRPVPPRIQLSRGVPPRTTMMWINSGAIVEVSDDFFFSFVFVCSPEAYFSIFLGDSCVCNKIIESK